MCTEWFTSALIDEEQRRWVRASLPRNINEAVEKALAWENNGSSPGPRVIHPGQSTYEPCQDLILVRMNLTMNRADVPGPYVRWVGPTETGTRVVVVVAKDSPLLPPSRPIPKSQPQKC